KPYRLPPRRLVGIHDIVRIHVAAQLHADIAASLHLRVNEPAPRRPALPDRVIRPRRFDLHPRSYCETGRGDQILVLGNVASLGIIPIDWIADRMKSSDVVGSVLNQTD